MSGKLKYGVIPAAGAGSRLGYLSTLLPKTLFPLYDRPIVHFVVDQMQQVGIEEIFIVVNVFKEKIVEYFDLIKMDLRVKINFIEQEQLNGTAEAILLAEKYIKDNPFMVIYGDDCTVTDSLPEMVDLFLSQNQNAVVMEGVVKERDTKILSQTCSVNLGKDNKIVEIIEKPERPPYLMRGCGVYLFRNKIFDFIRETPIHPVRKEKEITYTINSIAQQKLAYGYLINGKNVNINDYNELLKAGHLVKMLRK